MAKDRSEQHNLAGAKAETMKTMAAKWKQIDEGFVRQRESAKPTTKRRMPVAG
jgi:phage-related tail protein